MIAFFLPKYLQISIIFCTFVADFTPKSVAIATKFEIKLRYGYTKK